MQGFVAGEIQRDRKRLRNCKALCTNAVRQGLMVASPVGGALGGHRAGHTLRLSRGGRKAHSRPPFDGIQS
jgi:hypothetical protein